MAGPTKEVGEELKLAEKTEAAADLAGRTRMPGSIE
jgi:hypothetical protein